MGIETTASTWYMFIFRWLIIVDDITCHSFKLKNPSVNLVFCFSYAYGGFLSCFLLGSFFVFIIGFGGQL